MFSISRIFFLLVSARALSGFYLLASYLFSADYLLQLAKVPIYFSSLIVFYSCYGKHRILNHPIVNLCLYVLFPMSLLAAFIYGNNSLIAVLKHLYIPLMIAAAVSFGYFVAATYSKSLDAFIKTCFYAVFIFSVITTSVYLVFHFAIPLISYYGFDSEMPLATSLFLSQHSFGYVVSSVLIILASGKRAPLIAVTVVMVIYFIPRSFAKVRLSFLFGAFLLVLVFILAFFFLAKNDLLWRYASFTDLLPDASSDPASFDLILYRATSGRSSEIHGLLTHLSMEPLRFLWGSGVGAVYYVQNLLHPSESYYSNYSHLSALTFVFLYGIPATLFLFFSIVRLLVSNYCHRSNIYYLSMLCLFLLSFFGSSITFDPLFWVLVGFNIYMACPGSKSLLL
jgi:hypothetical protein